MKGYRKLSVFIILAGIAAAKLTGAELSAVLITLGTVFGAANAFEHRNG